MTKVFAFAASMVGALVGALLSIFVTTLIVTFLRFGPDAMLWMALILGSSFAVIGMRTGAHLVEKLFDGK